MVLGGGVVGFTYYTTTVPTPQDITLASATTILYNNGQQMAKLGDQNRELVTIRQIPLYVQREVASAEDRKFYEHSGVDYAGIVRAAFNNFTGGSKQGASTITQQYARNAYANLQGDTYARKVREAVLASKLNDKFSKDQIMEHYLNTIFFGRGAYGIQAAAQAYFGKSVDKLTVAEGAVLAGVIKQPLPDASTGHLGFDPAKNPTAAKERWDYVIQGMIDKKWLSPAERPTEYPKTVPVSDKCAIDCGVNSPQGNVVNYVKEEMAQMGICTAAEDPNSTKQTCSQALRDGGYKITTTIDKKMQEAAVATAQRASKGSLLNKQPPNLMAAVVSVDPNNGRVLAYYGGDNGTGTDYAGKNIENGVVTGGHPPGSTFKVYTLAAGLKAGKSLDSHWDATPFKIPGTEINVQNAGRNPGKNVSLEDATLQSYNVPFYYLTKDIGTDKVIDMAKAAGITTMWTTNTNPAKPYDLADKSGAELTPSPFFTGITGYGQYPITVLDHANGMATFAARGVYNKAHFVLLVEQKNKVTGQWEKVNGEQRAPKQAVPREVADNVTLVLKKYPKVVDHELASDRPAAEKTGTWELNETSKDNAHAWMVGYTPQLATAVWVGNVNGNKALRETDGTKISGSGLPGDIFERYMDAALKGKKVDQFPEGVQKIGDPNSGNGTPPPAPPSDSGCFDPFHIFCQNQNQNQGRGRQNPDRQNPDQQNPDQQNPNQLPGEGDGGVGGGVLPTSPTNRRN
ncbi:transglycosylase domain-containing protein [Micromonospora sp. NPDC049559]|uniref:transglycosylase domain-containing protein n=1 Tax=Micromonospora sp. NPDC049559 TaxID=3155923 RepID=UPI003425E0EA